MGFLKPSVSLSTQWNHLNPAKISSGGVRSLASLIPWRGASAPPPTASPCRRCLYSTTARWGRCALLRRTCSAHPSSRLPLRRVAFRARPRRILFLGARQGRCAWVFSWVICKQAVAQMISPEVSASLSTSSENSSSTEDFYSFRGEKDVHWLVAFASLSTKFILLFCRAHLCNTVHICTIKFLAELQ